MRNFDLVREELGEYEKLIALLDKGVQTSDDMREVVKGILTVIFSNFDTYQFSPSNLDGYLYMLRTFLFVSRDETNLYTMNIQGQEYISLKLDNDGKITEFAFQQYLGPLVDRRLFIQNGKDIHVELGRPEID